jgi:hypothetical protein
MQERIPRSQGKGIINIARTIGVGTGTVQRILEEA